MPEKPVAFMMKSRVSDMQLRFHVDRYLKEQSQPLTGSQLTTKKIYYPYWKVDATVLKLRNKTETKTISFDNETNEEHTIENDVSTVNVSPYHLTIAAGARMEGVPETIGIRSQTVRVVPFSEGNIEDEFDTLPVLRPWDLVNRTVHKAVSTMSNITPADFGRNITRMFNAHFSVIYFPYIIAECYDDRYRRFIVDGLSGRVLKSVQPGAQKNKPRVDNRLLYAGVRDDSVEDALSRGVSQHLLEQDDELVSDEVEPPQLEFGQLEVEFHRCHNCGVDLPPELSHVYICGNCQHMQMLHEHGYRLPEIQAVTYQGNFEDRLIPFWWLKMPEIMTGAFANLLGGVDQSERLYIPALRSGNFEAIYRLGKRMSAAHKRMDTGLVDVMDERYMSVRIGLDEAIALAEMIIYRELVDKGYKLPEEDIAIRPEEIGLVFVPFHLENYFYMDSALNAIGLEKTLVE